MKSFLVQLFLFASSVGLLTNDPVWVTSDYFQAGNQDVIWELTTSNVTPSYIFTFGTPFSGTPLLGYGVKGYQGGDWLGPQFFYVDRVALNATSFEVLVQIVGSTFIWILNVPYIAIDPQFPHRIVSFDNVPANFSSGDLTLFTQTQTSLLTYTNTINFTQQAGSLDYNTFLQPLTRNKIVLFTSSFYINGTKEPNLVTNNPIDLIIDAQVTSTTEYQISVTFGIKAFLEKLHFSEIIFDETDITDSLKYSLEYYTIDIYKPGMFHPLPQQFVGNLIIGFTDFSTPRTKTIFHTNYQFTTVGGEFGVYFPLRIATNTNSSRDSTPVDRVRYSFFYLKTWYCPDQTPLFDQITQLCSQCAVPNCNICYEVHKCKICDMENQYGIVQGTDQCELCDSANDYFVNTTTYKCQACPQIGCLDCASLTKCIICDVASEYHYDPVTQTCKTCEVSNCLDCINNNHTACQVCDQGSGYFLNDSNLLCEPCAPEGCLNCQTLQQCALCDEASDYFLNETSLLCVLCPVSMCLDCLSIDECLICDEASGYFLNTSNMSCEPCAVDNCVQCQTLGECAVCDEGSDFFLNDSTLLCQACQLSECTDCFSFEVCLQCNETAQFFLDPTSDLCVPCPVANCLECLSLNECAVCDEASNYFLNVTDQQCVECPIDNCMMCSSFSTCSVCNETNQYFLNMTDDHCVACPVQNCIECYSFEDCHICNETQGYFLNSSGLNCQPCSVEGCVLCSTLTECSICNESGNYFLHPITSQCISCSLDFCKFCQSEQKCGSCFQNYCLDSIKGICIECPKQQLVLGAEIARSGCNNFILSFEYDEEVFEIAQLEKFQRFKNAKVDLVVVKKKGNKYQIHAKYIEDLPTIIKYQLPNIAIIEVVYTPQLPAIKYSPEECAVIKNSKNAFAAIEAISYLTLGLSVVANCKLVGLQLFGLLQFSFFNLADNSYWNIYLSPLTEFSHLNGYNTPIFAQESSTMPKKINQMHLSSEFLNNCNIMLFLLFAQMLIGACLFVASKFIPKNKTLKKYSAILLKEGLVTFILFNTMNIAFSAGIHWKYSNGQSVISSVVLYFALAAIVTTAIGMEVMSKKGYGQFKQKFKKQWPCLWYVPLYIFYQSALGIYMSMQNQFEEGTFIIIGFCLFYGIYFLTNLPFIAFYHNYRAGLILVSQFSILLITNYYRSMKSTTEMYVKARIHTPAQLQISLLFASTGISVIVLSYQIYLWIKAKLLANKAQNIIPNIEDESRQAIPIPYQQEYFTE